jgi:hypothetical protein
MLAEWMILLNKCQEWVEGQVPVLVPVILTTLEAEIMRIKVWSQPRQIV